jgi:thioesterase-3
VASGGRESDAGRPHRWPRHTESIVLIPYADCDPSRQLGSGRCLDAFASARDRHWLQHYDLDIVQHARKAGASWVAREHRLAHLRPVRVHDEVLIRICLLDCEESEIVLESVMLDKKGSLAKVVSWSRYAHLDGKTGRPAPHPKPVAALFESIRVYVEEYSRRDFSARVQTLTETAGRTPSAVQEAP